MGRFNSDRYGRGPGNTKTEEIIHKVNKNKINDKLLKKIIKDNLVS